MPVSVSWLRKSRARTYQKVIIPCASHFGLIWGSPKSEVKGGKRIKTKVSVEREDTLNRDRRVTLGGSELLYLMPSLLYRPLISLDCLSG